MLTHVWMKAVAATVGNQCVAGNSEVSFSTKIKLL